MSTTLDIARLYTTFFNRPADPAGLTFWSGALEGSESLAAVARAMSGSAEFAAVFNPLSPSLAIDRLYSNLFGRHAEPSGLAYWVGMLESGALNVTQMALAITAGAQGSDATALTNKTTAAALFTSHLDTPEEIAAYSGAAANRIASAWLEMVSTAATLETAISTVDLAILSTDPANSAKLPFYAASIAAEKAARDAVSVADAKIALAANALAALAVRAGDSAAVIAETVSAEQLATASALAAAASAAASGAAKAGTAFQAAALLTDTPVDDASAAALLKTAQAETASAAKLLAQTSAIGAIFDANTNAAASAAAAANAAQLRSNAAALAYQQAATLAADAATAFTTAAAVADAAIGAATSQTLANAAATAAAAEHTAATLAATLAAAALTAAKAYVSAALGTSRLSDDTLAAAAVGSAQAAVNLATTHINDAIADEASAAALVGAFTGLGIVLTPGADTGSAFTGGLGDDTFTATGLTFTSGDILNGGLGVDTLTVVDGSGNGIATTGITVTSIERASLSSTVAMTVNTTGWTGLQVLALQASGGLVATVGAATDLSVTDNAQANMAVTVNGGHDVAVTTVGKTSTAATVTVGTGAAPTGTVSVVTSSGANSTTFTTGAIAVKGGTSVNIQSNLLGQIGQTITGGAIGVTGTALTTSVSVSQTAPATASGSATGVANGALTIADINGGSISAGTITSVSLANFTSLYLTDNALTTLSLTGGSGNIIIDNSGLLAPTNTALAVTMNGQSGGTLDDADIYTSLIITTTGVDSRLANITFGGMKALTVAGDKTLTMTSTAGASALRTVTLSGSAGLIADLSGGVLTSVNTSASTGASKMTIDASKATYTGGAGVDVVTLSQQSPSKAITLGDGADTLIMTSVSVIPSAAFSGGNGIDTLRMSAALAASGSGSGTFAGLVTGFERLELTGTTNQTIDLAVLGNYQYVSTSGGNGLTLNQMATGGTLTLSGAGTAYTIANPAFVSGLNDVINLKLVADNSASGTNFASNGLTTAGVETIAIAVTDTQATPTGSFNDSVRIAGMDVRTITVGGNAGLTLNAASQALTTVDASGISLGGFAWTSAALTGAVSVKGSATGTNTVNLVAASGANTYVGGTGNDIIEFGGGANSITVGTGSDVITFVGAVIASGTAYSTITDPHAGLKIVFADAGTAGGTPTYNVQQGTVGTTFQELLDAASASTSTAIDSQLNWFQFGGDTYLVEDNSASATFVNGGDNVVKLVGLVDVSSANFTISAGMLALTLA